MTRRTPRIAVTAAVLSSVVAIAGIAPTVASARPTGVAHEKKAKPRIAFLRFKPGGHTFRIITMDEDGKHPKTVKSRTVTDEDKIFSSVDLSPDGKWLVYTEGIGTQDAEIWTVKASGQGAKRIVNPPSGRSAFSPTWSPDGKKIVYVLSDGTTFSSLVVADADGKHPKQVYKSNISHESYPSWSPDGKKIVFSIRGAPTLRGGKPTWNRVATVKSSGGGFHFVTKPKPADAIAGGYSPDGKRIVFLERLADMRQGPLRAGTSLERLGPITRGSPGGLVVSVKANGKGRKVITGGTHTVGRILYAADGKRIIASRVGKGALDIYSHPLGPGPWKRLTHTQETYNLFDLFQVLFGD